MSVIQGNAFSEDDEVDTSDIGHSLRCRSAASAYLNRTFGAGNQKTWTWSGWLKVGSNLGANYRGLFRAGTSYFGLGGVGFSDNLWLNHQGLWSAHSTAVFRDPTAHVHVVVTYDTTQVTDTNRLRIYINGVQNTVTVDGGAWPAQNTDGPWNAAVVHESFRSASAAYDGVASRIAFVDGQALTPSSFGYLNTEINEWVTLSQSAVKAVVDAGGTNSFMLDFDDATSLTTLGYDKSSKGNNWTLNNFSLTAGTTYDHMLDVPGNSFATLNPLRQRNSGATFLNANLSATTETTTQLGICASIVLDRAEVWYAEVTAASHANNWIGVTANALLAADINTAGQQSVLYYANGNKYVNGSTTAYGASYTTENIGILFDGPNNQIKFFKGTSDQGWITLPSSTVDYVFCMANAAAAGTQFDWNFGQRTFTNKTTNAPTALALCQSNLPDVAAAVLNPTDGFVAVTATEDNIDSTLASARSGWSDFVDVKKNLAAVESWAWQLSHDSTNEYAVSASSLVRQAKRAMSGSNTWEGFSIRIGASYGTAAGSVSHTNGVATTITHNIGVSARQMILIFNRAGGTAVPMYHPDLTSGELLDLCTTAADAASTAITSVLTNSFQIGSGVATGTYDYLVCSELSGLFDLGKWTGNASADGAYYDAGHKPSVLYAKALSTTDDHRVYNALRPGYNVIGGVVLANTTAAETTAAEMDFTSQGMKARITTTPNAAQTYVTASWASVAGKYSLGR